MNKKSKKPGKPYEKIERQAVKNIKSERDRAVVFSGFTAKPIFEDKYYKYILKKPEYFEIYKKWVLSQAPYAMPKDENLYFLTKNIIVEINKDGTEIKIKKAVLFLLMDILNPFISGMLNRASVYYKVEDIKSKAIISTTAITATFCRPEDVARLGYPSFIPAFCDVFKTCLPGEIGVKYKKLPKKDELFAAAFEKEWQKLYPYSDALYGFEVIPVPSPDDMFRYLGLPFGNRIFQKLKKGKIYRETMNYIATMATFKPLPDAGVKKYFKDELVKLFEPLVDSDIKRVQENKQSGYSPNDINELKLELKKDLEKITNEFDFFYASTKNLDKEKISSFDNFFLPIRGVLVRLGHIFSGKEYPFTDYVAEKFRQKTKKYFPKEILNESYNSFDEEVGVESYGGGDGKDKLEDIIDEADLPISKVASGYDAKDSNGNKVGWTIETFAGFAGKSMKTLRDWDRKGFLVPERYGIYSRIHRKKIMYRAYKHEDIKKLGLSQKI